MTDLGCISPIVLKKALFGAEIVKIIHLLYE
ncbi:hypothetical protein SAMN05444714_3032 [Yoonia litorea]|uniref:Uncharacterized protein n=1 Tax=Yoonia litorea TaxID=1123755 RepID=A0A1I6N1X2_9RHOB|nr:hypothetical protein SAMN05444714_3032 [Yoonia litorea]